MMTQDFEFDILKMLNGHDSNTCVVKWNLIEDRFTFRYDDIGWCINFGMKNHLNVKFITDNGYIEEVEFSKY